MNGSLPGPARTIFLLAAVTARRWTNRFRGQFLKAFQRKRAAAAPPARTGTPRRSLGAGVLTAAFIGAALLFNSLNLATRFVGRLSEHVERQGAGDARIPVDARAYEAMTAIEESPRQRERERAEARLRRLLQREAERSGLDDDAASARAETLVRKFTDEGRDAFRPVRHRSFDFLPSSDAWPAPERAPTLVRWIAALFALLGIALFFVTLGPGQEELGKAEWSMEWLFTFPVSARVLFFGEVIGHALTNAMNWFITFPLATVLYASAGYGAWSVPMGLLVALYTGLLVASIRVPAEIWLRNHVAFHRIKNLQGVATIVGTLALMTVMWIGMAERVPASAVAAADAAPVWALWGPFSAPAFLCLGGGEAVTAGAALLAWAIAFVWAGVAASERMVRGGLLGASGTYQGTRGPSAPAARASPAAGWVRGVVGKELRLLSRDRNFLVQTLFVPTLIVGFNLLINPGTLTRIAGDFRHASTLAFGLASYVLMFSAVQVLSVEGQSLWLVYTFPHGLHRMLLQKCAMWCGFALLYALAVLVGAALVNPTLEWTALSNAVMAVAGVVVYTFIAGGLGVLGTDPLETTQTRKIRPEMIYLFMLLASLYAYGIYTPSVWNKIALVTLCTLLALALWQKVQDRIPYLLDPTAAPPPRIALADGLIAVLLFFVLQGLGVLLLGDVVESDGTRLLVAFVGAGAATAAATLYSFWRLKVPGVLEAVGLRSAQRGALGASAVWGLLLGAAAAGAGVFYLWIVEHVEALRLYREELEVRWQGEGMGGLWLLGMAVVAAPLFEEYIFRGLLFRGLRRSMHPAFAVLASAAIFAIVHPSLSIVPVFVLGVLAAVSFERGGTLLAPILAHAVYNAAVVGIAVSGR